MIRVRAKRRIGELSAALETDAGRPTKNSSQAWEELPKAQQLKAAGLSTSEAHRCEQLAAVPIQEFEATLAEHRDEQQAVTG